MARRILNVFLGENLVGQLEQDASGSTRFEYSEAWLNLPQAVPLSVSLPLESGKFHRNKTRPFFAGLLPEEQIRRVVASAFGVSERNDFALLEKIGAECAGAVSLRPPGEHPLDENPAYRQIDESQLGERLQSLPQHPLLAGEKGIRLSLAGAQGKLALRVDAGRFLLPLEGSPSTHILKPENPRFPGLVENEFFCMRLAAAVGLETARVEIGSASSIRFLQVERYDRRSENGRRITRIHQEDFCQALGFAPELKYEAEGGPGLKKCFELVRSVCGIPGPDILRLLDAVVFNSLIGNCDAHAKNFSLLRDEGSVRLAPLYDLVSTSVYPALANELAMKIGDERNPVRLTAKNWHSFFEQAGIGQALARLRALSVSARVLKAAENLVREDCLGATTVAPIVRQACGRLRGLRW
jgi:serine/threonine-protein kinase HipA